MCREGSAGGGSVLSGDGAALNLRGAHPFRLLAHPPTRTSTLLLTRGSPHPRRPPDLSRVTAPQAFFLGGGKQRAAPRRRRTPTETPGGGGAVGSVLLEAARLAVTRARLAGGKLPKTPAHLAPLIPPATPPPASPTLCPPRLPPGQYDVLTMSQVGRPWDY